jgi:hypothetical protein
MTNGSLILYPKSLTGNPTTATGLIGHLTAMGLLGAPLDELNNLFRVGNRFLQLGSFVGCSPYLQLEPPADGSDNFCHMLLHGPLESPRLYYGEGVRPPRCPSCGTALIKWRQDVSSGLIGCRECGAKQPAEAIAWGKHAGYGRLFVEIRNIFPGEAIPAAELLNSLRDLDLGEWGYFYLQGDREFS